MSGKRITYCLRGLAVLTLLSIAPISGFAQDDKKPAADDALPEGALWRLGSSRWRHGEPITFVAMPADGKTLLTAGQDTVVRLWDRETGKEIRRFQPPQSKNNARFNFFYMQGLTRAAVSKDGKLLAVALHNNTVQLWEVETGKALHKLPMPTNGVAAMAFTPDAKALVVRGASDRIAHLYDTATGKEIRQLKPAPPAGNKGNIFGGAGDGTGFAISSDGKTIALAELEFDGQKVSGSVTLMEIATGKEIRRIESATNGISAVAFSPDGKTLVHNTHNTIHVRDAQTGQEIRQLKGINGANLIQFSPDGKTLAVKSRDLQVRLYDVAKGDLLRTLAEPPGQQGRNRNFVNSNGALPTDMDFSADGATLVIGGEHMPRFFDVATGKERPLAGGGHHGAVSALLASADARMIYSRGSEGIVRVWNVADRQEVRQIVEPSGTSAVAFAPDGKHLALGDNDGVVHILELANGKQTRQLKTHQGAVATLAFSADGKRLATRGSYDGVLRVYDVERGTELKQIVFHDIKAGNGNLIVRTVNGQRDAHPLVFSPDGKTVAIFVTPQQILVQGRQQVQPDSNCLRLFDVGTGREVRNIPMPAGCTIHQLAYSFDGRLLISENTDKTISLWEVASGQERSRFGQAVAPGPQSISTTFVAINGNFRVGPALAPLGVTVAVSRDGSLIAAPGVNHSIKIFDASLGKEVGTFRGHDGAVTSLVFSPDSKTLLSGSGDTSVLGWDLARLKREPRPPVAAEPKVLDRLWADLIDSDAKKAGQSLQMLLSATNGSVALLSERIQPAAPVDITKVEQWLRDLDSSNFKQRALATRELQKLGELAIPALQKVLATRPSLEIRRRVEPMLEDLTGRNLSPEQIRIVRAIEVLDKIGTPEAKQLLERLAGGAPGSLTTLQAQMSLDRLNASK